MRFLSSEWRKVSPNFLQTFAFSNKQKIRPDWETKSITLSAPLGAAAGYPIEALGVAGGWRKERGLLDKKKKKGDLSVGMEKIAPEWIRNTWAIIGVEGGGSYFLSKIVSREAIDEQLKDTWGKDNQRQG